MAASSRSAWPISPPAFEVFAERSHRLGDAPHRTDQEKIEAGEHQPGGERGYEHGDGDDTLGIIDQRAPDRRFVQHDADFLRVSDPGRRDDMQHAVTAEQQAVETVTKIAQSGGGLQVYGPVDMVRHGINQIQFALGGAF